MKHLPRTFLCIALLFSSSIFASPVNINSATAQQIAKALNGVGIKKAQAIIDYRHQNGVFSDVNALMSVKGIGQSIVSKNKQDILFK